jgi:putative transposase
MWTPVGAELAPAPREPARAPVKDFLTRATAPVQKSADSLVLAAKSPISQAQVTDQPLRRAAVVRKTIRLRDFDYSSTGAYFITICTWRRHPLLKGPVLQMVEDEWTALPRRFRGLALDTSMFMVDHLHGIVWLSDSSATLPRIVQAFKSISARRAKRAGTVDELWQRSFYDHVVRSDGELDALRQYIVNNPTVHAVRIGAGPSR